MGNLGDLSPGGSVAIGILVGLLSTSVQSLGLTLQRKSHILEDEKDDQDVRRPPHRRRRWQLGMGMFIISNLVGSTIQITTLPLPVLSTLQASGLVFNSICATLILGEPFTRWSLGGTILVSSGAVLIAIFGAIPEPAHNLDQLLQLLGRRTFILWMVFQTMLVVGIIIIAGSLAKFPSIAVSPRIRLWRGLAYGCISGILSAHSLLVAKSAVELLVRTIIDRVNQFNRWQSWAILVGLVTLALTQLYFLHRGLKLVSTSVLYPLVFCIYNIIAILDGLIYFDQADRLPALYACLIALGTAILLSGVLALSWRLSDEQTQPAVAKSALAPGLGFVEDTDMDESSDSYNADEESSIGAEHRALLNGEPLTPTAKLDTVLGATRNVRKPVRLTEADEIWSELQDDDSKPGSPNTTKRSLSMTTTPQQSTSQEPPDETTSLLPSHSSHRRRRRRSTGFPGFTARPSPRTPNKRRASRQSQGATGGFWKMQWWKRGGGGGKGPPDPEDGGGVT
ncbi:Multidrug resistance efflux transporter EmrE [Venustampulla echinocandica]|uniref:Multidrug resistance efflux transporter EmrE n=1 Tax=Venustampulla echinocandica TaxID=2656787 RepID=A0A370TNN8_9HELO|nr:Multidrug resistance efflux transporter EmrE [Venustampulla echinocandica]RDL37130.1 Multidrug resistance efflux transporter EmrE [Venustampulla echinocandica]